MPTAPTAHTPLPAAPSTDDPANFDTEADAFVGALETFGDQMDALADNAYDNAVAAASSASAASTSAGTATTKAGEAASSATAAANSATAAAGSATAAANSATAAANAAAGAAFTATSTTSNSIGGGEKTWAVGTGRSYQAGLFVVVSDAADTSNYCHGQVTDYSGGNLTVDVTTSGGSGTYTSWNIGLSGPEGPAASLPAGLISMWSGTIASIPAGWALCDGTSGTPDLRSKFVVGASSSGGYAVGATGGQTSVTPTITVANHTLTESQMPAHTHGLSSSSVGASGGLQQAGTGSTTTTSSTGGGGAHNHNASSSAVSTLPPYYALAFIMKL